MWLEYLQPWTSFEDMEKVVDVHFRVCSMPLQRTQCMQAGERGEKTLAGTFSRGLVVGCGDALTRWECKRRHGRYPQVTVPLRRGEESADWASGREGRWCPGCERFRGRGTRHSRRDGQGPFSTLARRT